MDGNLPKDPGAFPGRITLELTNRCNLHCSFCPRRLMEKRRGFMDTELAKRLLREMAGHAPVAVVPFFRGESLLHPEWFEILSYAKELGVGEIQFTSNASLLTPEVAERLLDLALPFISFSLDTVDADLYNGSRCGADFETTRANVLHFLKRKQERGVATQVQASAVGTPAHQPGMQAFVDYWLPKVDRVRVYVEHSSDGKPGSIGQGLPQFKRRLPCHKPSTDMVIYWSGEVALCNHDWTRLVDGTPLGDVARDGIAQVWRSPAYQAVRQAHMEGSLEGLAPCHGCDHWKMYHLSGGFLGQLYENGHEQKQRA